MEVSTPDAAKQYGMRMPSLELGGHADTPHMPQKKLSFTNVEPPTPAPPRLPPTDSDANLASATVSPTTKPHKDTFRVYLRIRPDHGTAEGEDHGRNDTLQLINDETIKVKVPQMSRSFTHKQHAAAEHFVFNKVFPKKSEQEHVFEETAQPVVDTVMSGKDGLLFVYGVTNAGKTFTMEGSSDDPGVIPRTLNAVFSSIADVTSSSDDDDDPSDNEAGAGNNNLSYSVSVSYLQIYKDDIHDLQPMTAEEAQDDASSKGNHAVGVVGRRNSGNMASMQPVSKVALSIRTQSNDRTDVKGLRSTKITNAEEGLKVLHLGKKHRTTRSTKLNAQSSRSHAVYIIFISKTDNETSKTTESRLYLVDLAGSERSKRTNGTHDLVQEAAKINVSLMVLMKCLNELRNNQNLARLYPGQKKGKGNTIPFNYCKLTRLLRGPLCGRNSGMVVMIVNASAKAEDYDETSHALKYGKLAKGVQLASGGFEPSSNSSSFPGATVVQYGLDGRRMLVPVDTTATKASTTRGNGNDDGDENDVALVNKKRTPGKQFQGEQQMLDNMSPAARRAAVKRGGTAYMRGKTTLGSTPNGTRPRLDSTNSASSCVAELPVPGFNTPNKGRCDGGEEQQQQEYLAYDDVEAFEHARMLEIERLQKEVADARVQRVLLEAEIREEVSREMASNLKDMEITFRAKIEFAKKILEGHAEARIQKLNRRMDKHANTMQEQQDQYAKTGYGSGEEEEEEMDTNEIDSEVAYMVEAAQAEVRECKSQIMECEDEMKRMQEIHNMELDSLRAEMRAQESINVAAAATTSARRAGEDDDDEEENCCSDCDGDEVHSDENKAGVHLDIVREEEEEGGEESKTDVDVKQVDVVSGDTELAKSDTIDCEGSVSSVAAISALELQVQQLRDQLAKEQVRRVRVEQRLEDEEAKLYPVMQLNRDLEHDLSRARHEARRQASTVALAKSKLTLQSVRELEQEVPPPLPRAPKPRLSSMFAPEPSLDPRLIILADVGGDDVDTGRPRPPKRKSNERDDPRHDNEYYAADDRPSASSFGSSTASLSSVTVTTTETATRATGGREQGPPAPAPRPTLFPIPAHNNINIAGASSLHELWGAATLEPSSCPVADDDMATDLLPNENANNNSNKKANETGGKLKPISRTGSMPVSSNQSRSKDVIISSRRTTAPGISRIPSSSSMAAGVHKKLRSSATNTNTRTPEKHKHSSGPELRRLHHEQEAAAAAAARGGGGGGPRHPLRSRTNSAATTTHTIPPNGKDSRQSTRMTGVSKATAAAAIRREAGAVAMAASKAPTGRRVIVRTMSNVSSSHANKVNDVPLRRGNSSSDVIMKRAESIDETRPYADSSRDNSFKSSRSSTSLSLGGPETLPAAPPLMVSPPMSIAAAAVASGKVGAGSASKNAGGTGFVKSRIKRIGNMLSGKKRTAGVGVSSPGGHNVNNNGSTSTRAAMAAKGFFRSVHLPGHLRQSSPESTAPLTAAPVPVLAGSPTRVSAPRPTMAASPLVIGAAVAEARRAAQAAVEAAVAAAAVAAAHSPARSLSFALEQAADDVDVDANYEPSKNGETASDGENDASGDVLMDEEEEEEEEEGGKLGQQGLEGEDNRNTKTNVPRAKKTTMPVTNTPIARRTRGGRRGLGTYVDHDRPVPKIGNKL